MLRGFGRLVLGALLFLSVASGCAPLPRENPDIQNRVRQSLPTDDAETRFVGPAIFYNLRTLPSFAEALLVPGRQGPQHLNGAVAVTDRNLYFLYWDARHARYNISRPIPLAALVKIEFYSRSFLMQYFIDVETRDPPHIARDGVQMTGRYRYGIITPFDTGSQSETRALCEEIARRRALIEVPGEAPEIRCE